MSEQIIDRIVTILENISKNQVLMHKRIRHLELISKKKTSRKKKRRSKK